MNIKLYKYPLERIKRLHEISKEFHREITLENLEVEIKAHKDNMEAMADNMESSQAMIERFKNI